MIVHRGRGQRVEKLSLCLQGLYGSCLNFSLIHLLHFELITLFSKFICLGVTGNFFLCVKWDCLV